MRKRTILAVLLVSATLALAVWLTGRQLARGPKEPGPAGKESVESSKVMRPAPGAPMTPLSGGLDTRPYPLGVEPEVFVKELLSQPLPAPSEFPEFEKKMDALMDDVAERQPGGWKQMKEMARAIQAEDPEGLRKSCTALKRDYKRGREDALKSAGPTGGTSPFQQMTPEEQAETKRLMYMTYFMSRFQYRICDDLYSD